MSEFEQNIPDDFWQKAFEEATETPPPRVWDAIEHRLDESDGAKVLPLWGTGPVSSRPFVWSLGIAAAVALLLVGRWVPTTSPDSPVAHHQEPYRAERVAAVPLPKATDCWPSSKAPLKRLSAPDQRAWERVALNQKPTSAPHNRQTPAQPANRPVAETRLQPMPEPIVAAAESVGDQRVADVQPARIGQRTVVSIARVDGPMNDQVTFTRSAATSTTLANPSRLTGESSLVSTRQPVAEQPLSFEPVPAVALRLREPGSIQRPVWFHPTEPAVEAAVAAVQPKRKTREVWASVSIMPGAFNPSVAVRSAQASFTQSNALSNVSTTAQSSVNSRASFSVACQAGAGIQLTERWSVESGVGYLAGRSTVESPVQASVLNCQLADPGRSAQHTNLYVDALRTSSRNALPATNSAFTGNSTANFNTTAADILRYTVPNNYNSQTLQTLANDYQFVQVPVQVGYQLRPRKRLSLALLGGFLTNIFVRNTVGDELVITTKNGVYRPVSWAATMGARFRYRPSRQWSASLAGLYQPALGPGTRSESAVQSHPISMGMSFGIDYHF